jgi:UDP-N-acetyl-D-mannosaminuronic acid dehydrogenase
MQLAAFNASGFSLGQAAMAINEGLPSFIVNGLKHRYKLDETKVGILGMAFKADIDDIRDSLSYKLGKVLRFHGAEVHYSDEFAKDPTFITKEQLAARCDVVIVGVPHSAYRTLTIPSHVEVLDLWGVIPVQGRVPAGAARTS